MEPWWERHQKAFDDEIAALNGIAHLGYSWTIDDAARSEGRLVIKLALDRGDGEALKLTARYPDSFPYFQPQVELEGVLLGRHQHPLGRNLCLLEREGEAWQPGRDTLAALLRDQFPKVTKIAAGEMTPEEVAKNEDHVGEPAASFLPYFPGCALIVPDKSPPAGIAYGHLSLVVREKPSGWPQNHPFVNGVVQRISDANHLPLVQFPCAIPAFTRHLNGFWARLPAPPKVSAQTDDEAIALMGLTVPAFRKAINTARRGQVIVAGFVYRDEVTWSSESDDWFFVAIKIEQEGRKNRPPQIRKFFVRADWGGEDAWMRRAPSLRPLRNRSVLLFGLGSLGSPVALHLARAGVRHLRLMDSDDLQVGNTIRWALGWQYAGLKKSWALRMHLEAEYPLTQVEATDLRLGLPRAAIADGPSDYEILRKAIEESDLVVDASASQRVSNFLADLATELGKPFLWLTATPGTAGGVVGRIVPGKTPGCWHCFQRSLADGTIKSPADLGTPNIQPPGCSQATFVGAGIDSDEIALLAARLAVATLCRGEANGFPDFDWSVAVVTLKQGVVSIAPHWTDYPLNRHASCQACAQP